MPISIPVAHRHRVTGTRHNEWIYTDICPQPPNFSVLMMTKGKTVGKQMSICLLHFDSTSNTIYYDKYSMTEKLQKWKSFFHSTVISW